jgi:hypothetical protein
MPVLSRQFLPGGDNKVLTICSCLEQCLECRLNISVITSNKGRLSKEEIECMVDGVGVDDAEVDIP